MDKDQVPDEISALMKEAERVDNEANESRNNDDNNNLPIVFLPEGKTKLRFYLDPEGKFSRCMYRYKIDGVLNDEGKKITIRLPYQEGNPIEKLQKELENLDYKDAWKYRPSQHFLSYAYLISSSNTQEVVTENIDNAVLLEMKYKVYLRVMSTIRDMNVNTVTDLFTPEKEMNVWVLDYQRGRGGNVSVSTDISLKSSIPPLPETVPPLKEAWIPENATMEDREDDITLVVKHMRKLIDHLTKSKAPDPDAAASTSAPTLKEDLDNMDMENMKPTEGEDDLPFDSNSKSESVECPNKDKGFEFGKFQMEPECIMCEHKSACQQASNT